MSPSRDKGSEVSTLRRGLLYDLWANDVWLAALPSLPNQARAQEVLLHVLESQAAWLQRIGEPFEDDPNLAMHDRFQALHDRWLRVISERPLSERVSYRTRAGEPYVNRLADIVAHVINHGTYHRGHLRGLAEAAASSFPDTDLILYLRE